MESDEQTTLGKKELVQEYIDTLPTIAPPNTATLDTLDDVQDDKTENDVVGSMRSFLSVTPNLSHDIHTVSKNRVDHTYGRKNYSKGRPLTLCRIFTKRPYFWFGVTLGIQLAFLVVTVILFFSGYRIFPYNFETQPMVMKNSDVYREYLAWTYRYESPNIYKRKAVNFDNNPINAYIKQRSPEELLATMIFQKKDENILTREYLKAIRDFENEIFYDIKYQSKYCDMFEDKECIKPLSLIRFFDGTFSALNSTLNDIDFLNIPQVLETAFTQPFTRGIFTMLVGKDFSVSSSQANTEITQIFIYVNKDMKPKYYMISTWYTVFQDMAKNGYKGMKVLYRNEFMIFHEIFEAIVVDFLWITASVFFIFSFMWFQTESFFLTFWGMFSTVTSFVTANFIYNIVFDYQYFGLFQILSVFVTLGIAADDVFIFCDTWKEISVQSFPTLEHRLSACFHIASNSMFVTSVATAVAFFSNAINPILAVSSFGAYSGIVILTNYISVILFYPNVMLVYHLNFASYCKCGHDKCCGRCRLKTSTDTNLISEHKSSERIVVRFLSGPYFRLVNNRVYQIGVLVFYASAISMFSYYFTKLAADQKPPQIFKKGHQSEQFIEMSSTDFYQQDVNKLITLSVVWGIEMQNVAECHPRQFDIELCKGRTNFKKDFDLNKKAMQWNVLNFCKKLYRLKEEERKRLHVRINPENQLPKVNCPVLSMDNFLKMEYKQRLTNRTKYSSELSFNITKPKARMLMASNPQIYNMSKIPSDFTRYFEAVYAYWLTNGHGTGTQPPADQALLSHLVGEMNETKNLIHLEGDAKEEIIGTKIAFMGVQVVLDMSWDKTYYKDGLNLYQKWVDFVKKHTNSQAFQTSEYLEWHFYHLVNALINQCFISVTAGVLLAWAILVLSSGNYIVGTMAAVCIFAVVLCVLGAVPLAGWKLGILEALNTTLVVGLSVDYVVHMGIAYNHSGYKDRRNRVRHALKHMGVSVLSGATTTIGSSFFMLFTRISFFGQFATFMLFTISFSICFALTLFMVVLIMIGPQGNTGSNKVLAQKIKRLLFTRLCTRKIKKGKSRRHKAIKTTPAIPDSAQKDKVLIQVRDEDEDVVMKIKDLSNSETIKSQ